MANLSLPFFPHDMRYAPVVTLGLGLAIHELVMTGGFYFSHKELAGRHSGVLFGMTNTMAQIPGFVNPLLIAWLTPNVSPDSHSCCAKHYYRHHMFAEDKG